jgi:hypothetical protein
MKLIVAAIASKFQYIFQGVDIAVKNVANNERISVKYSNTSGKLINKVSEC